MIVKMLKENGVIKKRLFISMTQNCDKVKALSNIKENEDWGLSDYSPNGEWTWHCCKVGKSCIILNSFNIMQFNLSASYLLLIQHDLLHLYWETNDHRLNF